jgi:hypothetical protein
MQQIDSLLLGSVQLASWYLFYRTSAHRENMVWKEVVNLELKLIPGDMKRLGQRRMVESPNNRRHLCIVPIRVLRIRLNIEVSSQQGLVLDQELLTLTCKFCTWNRVWNQQHGGLWVLTHGCSISNQCGQMTNLQRLWHRVRSTVEAWHNPGEMGTPGMAEGIFR